MDSNHRRPDVSRESSPLDYGIVIEDSCRNGLIGSRTPCISFPADPCISFPADRVRFARPASYGWTIRPLISWKGSQDQGHGRFQNENRGGTQRRERKKF